MGPATANPEVMGQLKNAGMNVARLNCSHGDWEQKRDFIKWIRELHDGFNPIAIMADLQGPKFRIGDVESGVVNLIEGQIITMGHGHGAMLPMKDDAIFAAMTRGSHILFGDGEVEVKLGESKDGVFDAEVITSGKVKSRQGITLVGKSFDVGCLTSKDIEDLKQAIAYGVDYLALSYVRRASDILELRKIVDGYDPGIKIIAKIETKESLHDLGSIIEASDAIMVARGDLGLQMDLEDVPLSQKRIIRETHKAGKPVITATQMMESMITNSRPTRAEASDVANAILDGTDAVMLSGETASGAYPVETVKTMARIAQKTEALLESEDFMHFVHNAKKSDTTEAVAMAAVSIANTLKVKAILTMSESGFTPKMVAKFRPKAPIFCASWHHRVQNQNALIWGVQSLNMPPTNNTDEAVQFLMDGFCQRKLLKSGDKVVVVAGAPPGTSGNTNMIMVKIV